MAYNPPANNAVNFVLKSYTTPANNAVNFNLDDAGGTVVALTLDDYAFQGLTLEDLQVSLIYSFILDDYAFSELTLEPLTLGVDVLVLDDFRFTPLNLGGTLIIEEGYMSVTLARGGMVYKLTAAGDVIAKDLFVKRIRWVGATTIGHAIEVRAYPYAATDTIHEDVANSASYTGEVDFGNEPLRIDGIKLQSVNSGTVYVYVK